MGFLKTQRVRGNNADTDSPYQALLYINSKKRGHRKVSRYVGTVPTVPVRVADPDPDPYPDPIGRYFGYAKLYKRGKIILKSEL